MELGREHALSILLRFGTLTITSPMSRIPYQRAGPDRVQHPRASVISHGGEWDGTRAQALFF